MRKLGSREIEEFKNYFQDYHESYILIGGSNHTKSGILQFYD